MPLPDFTQDERYLINVLKAQKNGSTFNPYMWSYVVGGVLIAAFAAYYGNVFMMLAAFAIVCAFRVYEEYYQARWSLLYGSIIEKYEAAILGERANTADDLGAEA